MLAGIFCGVATMQGAFSNIRVTIHDAFAEGDKACVRGSSTVQHTGAMMGMAATAKGVEVTGITMARVVGGKIAAAWQNWDMLGMRQLLGDASIGPTYLQS